MDKEKRAENTDTLPRLSRGRVAECLGVSIATVRRMEGTELHPTVSDSDL